MQLSDDNLFFDSLPRDWLPLLELLHELDLLVSQRHTGALEELRTKADLLRTQILENARLLSEETPPKLQASSPEFRRWFTEAVLLWPLFADTGGVVLANTIGTTVLANYPVDFRANEEDREVLRRALQRMYGWSRQELEEIESNLRRYTSNLSVKGAIARGLCVILGAADSGQIRENAADLMRSVYGAVPWLPGDVDVVVSTSAVFFCLPFDGVALTSTGFDERPESERDGISAFLERVRSAQQSLKGIRFPAFGFFDPALVDPALIARLTVMVNHDPVLRSLPRFDDRQIEAIFATMVTILPTHEADKYLVHDVWGHGWQESLCEFETIYADISSLDDSSKVPAEAFEARQGKSVLRPEELLRVVESDLRNRISTGINLVVSEFLADLVEFKFLRHHGQLPSSSLFVETPLCLDLSLEDTRRMVRAWRRGYSELSGEAAAFIESRFMAALNDSTEVTPTPDGVRVNLLQRILLSVFALDAALDRFLVEGEAHYRSLCSDRQVPRWHCPVACTDLLVLLLGWFYEQHRAVNVWGLDELVTRELRPALLQLEAAIRSRDEAPLQW
jgi:hypothetical protein